MHARHRYARVVVVGTSGVGKTTLAARLAAALGTQHVELDAIYWNAGWQPTPAAEFEAEVGSRLSAEAWVVDGNYSAVRSQLWSRATAVVWLNYPLRISFGRLVMRTLRRSFSGEECCNGNQESLVTAFLRRDSILLWALTSHPKYKREYPLAIEAHPQLAVDELHRPREAEALLRAFETAERRDRSPMAR